MSARAPAIRNQAFVSLLLVTTALVFAWLMGGWISTGDTRTLALSFVFFGVCVISVMILRNWRAGFYFFIVWLLFEDLMRKFLGNSMIVYFAKDFLAALTCIALLIEIRRGREALFRPPFMLWLSLFFWLGFLQVFNPNSPSILYGLLGVKLYYSYIPLMYAGYAIIRSEEDLHHFLMINLGLAGVISFLGIVQAVVGPSFLNPAVLAPEIRELSQLERYSPITHQSVFRPSSVFVSDGRFAWYLALAWMIGLGTTGFLLFKSRRGRKIAFTAVALIAVASLLCGSRGTAVSFLITGVILTVAFIWGAPWRQRQVYRLMKALRRSAIVAALAIGLMAFLFPTAVASRLAFYVETLSPTSESNELTSRLATYPYQNLAAAFQNPNWVYGNGIGTSSLGVQYVSRLLGERSPSMGLENGYATLIVEMGILGPVLWTFWTVALLIPAWRIVRRLKGSSLFPTAMALFFFCFYLLVLQTYGGLLAYQNYVNNAYLWILIGVLFRLPHLKNLQSVSPVAIAPVQHAP